MDFPNLGIVSSLEEEEAEEKEGEHLYEENPYTPKEVKQASTFYFPPPPPL